MMCLRAPGKVGFKGNSEIIFPFSQQNIWPWLFKTNDVVSQCLVKFAEVNFSNMSIFFVEKM